MSELERFARYDPDHIAAAIAGTDTRITYGELHARSVRFAAVLMEQLPEGAVIAILLSNRLEYFEVCFAARRAGLYYVPISSHLNAAEIDYLLRDSGAALLITESRYRPVLEQIPAPSPSQRHWLLVDEPTPSSGSYRSIVETGEVPSLPPRATGLDFAYSSGTTGRPKGIRHRLHGDEQLRKATTGAGWLAFFDLDASSVYLSTAPLYHAAPLRFSIRCITNGGTAVVMRRFDPLGALSAIETHRVTHSQWVPTMFIRMLALSDAERERFDLSSHRIALHAAAPCPIDIKRRMLDWWGPMIWEYYTGSERAGATFISPQEWLEHPGSVGRAAQGQLHILGDNDLEVPNGIDGLVCFEGGPKFEYHQDPVKTAQAHTPQGWATFGDIGHVDADGYLFLTDRRANMIISGGVNIYPQEAENLLLQHPQVREVAVIGVPHPEFGEEVKAVVELNDASAASPQLAQTLIDYCRSHLSHLKCPRSVDFATDLPRTETGKLLKRLIRDDYRRRTHGL